MARFPMMNMPRLASVEGKKYKVKLYSEIMHRINPQKMICCICEKEILLSLVETHTKLCSKKTNYKKDLIQLQEQIHLIQEQSSTKEIEYITKINFYNKQRLSEKNLSHQNSPITRQYQQQPQLTLSKFANPDHPARQFHRAKTINLSEDSFSLRTKKRQLTRQFDGSMSPDSQRQIKSAIQMLKIVQQYCQKIMKQDTDSFEIDVKFHSLIKFGLFEVAHLPDLHELMQHSLSVINLRIDCLKKIKKLEIQIKDLNIGQMDKIKKVFQKGISNSFKININRSSSNQKIRVMEMLQKPKSRFQSKFKEDSVGTPISNSEGKTSIQIPDSDERLASLQMFSQEENDHDGSFIRGYFSDSGVLVSQVQQVLKIGLKDFEFIDVLGVGAYGAVWKVRKLKTNDIYAMKVIDTQQTVNKNLLKTLKAEKDVFAVIEGDFVAKAFYSFSQKDCLFYCLEYIRGGDFDKILRKYGALDEAIAKFYLAELLLAIEALHKKHIIHRDLKPENILLDANGHIKLTDFGLSEFGMKMKMQHNDPPSKALELQGKIERKIKTTNYKSPKLDHCIQLKVSQHKHRIIGTPDYIAPEVIQQESYINESIDMWSLGVLAYEFLIGIPPFNDESPEKIFENILQRKIEWPEIGEGENELSCRAKDLISRLLDWNFRTRMRVEEAKEHEFFAGINFETLRKEKAPITPDDDPEDRPLMQLKKQREYEKLNNLLKDTSSENSRIAKLGMDNLLRLDLLVEMNQKKAHQLRSRKYV